MESKQLKHTAEQVDETIDKVSRFKIRKQGKSHGNKIIVRRVPKLNPWTVGNRYLVTGDRGNGSGEILVISMYPDNAEKVVIEVNGRRITRYWWRRTDNIVGSAIENLWQGGSHSDGYVPDKGKCSVRFAYDGIETDKPYIVKVLGYEEEAEIGKAETSIVVYRLEVYSTTELSVNETSSPNLVLRNGRIRSVEPPAELDANNLSGRGKNMYVRKYRKYRRFYLCGRYETDRGVITIREYEGVSYKYAKRNYCFWKKPHKCCIQARTRGRWASSIVRYTFIK